MTDPRLAQALVHERGTAHQPTQHRVPSYPSLQARGVERIGIGRRAGEPAHEPGDGSSIARGVRRRHGLGVLHVVAVAAQHRAESIGRSGPRGIDGHARDRRPEGHRGMQALIQRRHLSE